MKRTKTIKSIVVRLAVGTMLQGSAFAGPATYLYWQEPPLPSMHSAVRPLHDSVVKKPHQKTKWPGASHLLTVGQGVISINQFDQ